MKFQAEFDINIEEIKKNQPQMAADEIESYAASRLNNSGDGITLRDLRRAPLHLHPNGDMPDICPVCGAAIESVDREIEDDWCSCSFVCENCGAYGNIAEDIVFDQYYKIYDKDGNRIYTGRDEGIDGVDKAAEENKGKIPHQPKAPRSFEAEISNAEKQLFTLLLMQALEGTVEDHMLGTKAYGLYDKYVDASKENGTWMNRIEAANAIGDIIVGSFDDAVPVNDLLAMDNKQFLELVEDAAETSVMNAINNE